MLRRTPILALLLVAPVLGSCDHDATSPAAAQETELSTDPTAYAAMTDRELVVAMLVRMDSLEARVERNTRAAVEEVVAALGDGSLSLARADRERSRGTEQCVEIKMGSEAEMQTVITILGNAFGGVGAWAGTGGSANLKAEAEAKARIEPLKGAIEVKKSWCFGRGATRDPVVGSAVANASLRAADPQDPQAVESALDALITQLGLTDARASQALSQLSTVAGGVPHCRPGDCVPQLLETLPIPGDLRGLLNDPRTFLRQRAPDYGDFALDQLCNLGFPGAFGTRLEQACDIRDRVPDTAELFGTYESLVGIPGLVAEIDDRLSVVCARTSDLISGVNGFSIEKHAFFKQDLRWPGPDIAVLGTNCRVIRSG